MVLTTDRLLLRLWRDADVAPFVALNADPAVTEYLPGPVTPEQAVQFFSAQNAMHARHGCCYFAAELKETGELAGFVGLKYQDFATSFAPCHEVGWRLASRHWGKGLASEGARAALRFGFGRLGLHEIMSFTVAENARSRRVMERLGMVRDPDGDFAHPALPVEHPLSQHVPYRLPRAAFGT
ncbi:GNAT family N-acetyltransferase [Pseudoduganella sp. SL102]|uniref:GNAT family N-acetyltransferase n=1 Tax=Pseudoduganella sp. SL102 TaxID=2995154 RepID=UPI00248AA30E|nr:GNAT family N-acetyltransferase [Pseudoduganella sp. SL102]WBS04364.1 GNAT family N-acetyltransferase [Pseudoduganella sp. SL102]